MTIKNKTVLVLVDVSGIGPCYHVGDEAITEVTLVDGEPGFW